MKSKSNLRICIITSWYPSKRFPNNFIFVENFAKNLAAYGIDVHVITTLHEGDIIKEEKDSLVIYRVQSKFPLISIFKIIKSIQPDIIHVQAPNYFSLSAIILSKLLKKKIIATIHRAEVDKVRSLIFVLRKVALRTFDQLICVSNYTKSLAVQAGADKNKVSIIYNSCDESFFHLRNEFEVRQILHIPTDKKVILFVGNLIQRKGIDTLIHSLNNLNHRYTNFIGIIIGQGTERQKLESLVDKYHLTDKIRFLEGISKTELPYYYSAADIFVLPSVSEGHSVALLEAMACGLPIVASDIPGNKESIENGKNGFIFDNEKSLTEKLLILLTNSELHKKMSESSSMMYAERFSTATQMEKYLELYKNLLEKKSRILLIDNQGLSHYSSYLAAGISKHRHVILCGFSKDDYIATGAHERANITYYDMIKRIPKARLLNGIRPFFLFLPLIIALTKFSYNVVHVQAHMPYLVFFAPLLKAKKKNIIWTLHDIDLRPSNQGLRGKLELFLLRSLSQPALFSNYADYIIVHGSSLKQRLISDKINPSKVLVIPHFDYLYLMKYSNNNRNNKLNSYALVFGKIKPYKGIDLVIECAKAAGERTGKEFRLMIAGKGNIDYFKRSLTDHNLYTNVEVRNEFIPIEEIPEIFHGAKFVLLPYKDASQSGVIPLAYTFSKPVIVSNVGAIGEYVEHGKTGFIFDAGNKNELVNYMLDLYGDNQKSNTMGRNAHQKLLRDMSLEKCVNEINKIYDRSS